MKLDYKSLLNEIGYYAVSNRKESAAFLMWYLENYYRLDKEEAIDCVCDNSGDKGVDGIYVNEAQGTIDVFQSKISQSDKKSIGDVVLKEFAGTLGQFGSKDSLVNMVESAGRAQVASLIDRIGLLEKLDAYPIRGIFVTNIDLSSDGVAYLKSNKQIEFLGRSALESDYISDKKEIKKHERAVFDISENEVASYFVDSETEAYIAPVSARELVRLSGIEDQSIFDYNVRGSLGNTKINKGLANSIKDADLHKMFPLFHNGITIVSDVVVKEDDKIILESFYVVNGCQSLTSLYKNQNHLTDNLKVLTKIVKVPIDSNLSRKITEYSNSQNGVKPRDFKSNNQIQVRLQNEVAEKFSKDYFYEIKRGEIGPAGVKVISNEVTGILLMSFDLKEPWGTHRKYKVFEDSYAELFARPEVNAEKVIFLDVLNEMISDKLKDISNQLIARYALTRYAIVYIVRIILEKDKLGNEMISMTNKILRQEADFKKLEKVLSSIIDDVIIDLNAEINDLDEDFDYKSKLRNEEWVRDLAKSITTSFEKQVARGRVNSFEKEWLKYAD